MKVYMLNWYYISDDGYDQSNDFIGLYMTEESAEEAGNLWLGTQDEEYYSYTILEVEVHA